jgi:conjugation system TraG family ATPase
MKKVNLDKKFPIMVIENNCLLNVNGDITYPLKITFPVLYSLSESELDSLTELWTRLLKYMPENYIIHKQDIFSNDKYSISKKNEDSIFEISSKLLYNNRFFLRHECYVYITRSHEKNIKKESAAGSLVLNPIKHIFTDKEIKEFQEIVNYIKESLKSSLVKLSVSDVTAEELVGSSRNFGLLEKYLTLDFTKNPTMVDITYNGSFKVGDKFVGILAATDTEHLPFEVSSTLEKDVYTNGKSKIFTSYLHPIATDLQYEHIVNQYFFIEDQAKFKKAVEGTAKKQMSLSKLSRENELNSASNIEFLEELIENDNKIISTAINVIYWNKSESAKETLSTTIKSKYDKMRIIPKEVSVNLFQMFWAGIPGNAADYPYEETMPLTENAAACMMSNETYLLPYNEDESDISHSIRLSDRTFGMPVRVGLQDRKKVDNFNKLVIGGSGGGKSFLTNHTVRQIYDSGGHVLIIDIGDSYKDITAVINEQSGGKHGLYYNYTEENPLSINPFQSDDFKISVERRSFLSALMFTLWKKDDEKITQAEATHVDTSLDQYIQYSKVERKKMGFNAYYEFLTTHFSEYVNGQKILPHNFDFMNYIQVLRTYYKGGSYDFLLNPTKDTNMLKNPFIVFEINSIKDHPILYRVVTLIIIDTFLEKMRYFDRSLPKALLIEEAWKVLASENTSAFIKELYKTARKYSAEIWTITQDISDILSNDIVRSAISKNTDYKIFLDIRKEKFNPEAFKNAFGIKDKEFDAMMSLNLNNRPGRIYKEAAFCLSGKIEEVLVYGVEVNNFEYAAYTSDGTEVALKEKIKKDSKTVTEALYKYAKLKFDKI